MYTTNNKKQIQIFKKEVMQTKKAGKATKGNNVTSTATRKTGATRSMLTTSPKNLGPGTPNRRPTLSKRIITQIQELKALGISMTNIHRIIGSKNKNVNYYDVWKVASDAA